MQGQLMPQDVSKLFELQKKLFEKVLNVVKGVEVIEKSGYNKHQHYAYATEADLVNAVRKLLIDNKLLVFTDSETKDSQKLTKADKTGGTKESLVTTVNTRHTFCDVETGYTYSIQSTGQGWDELDKGSYKAITGSFKYFISKNFLVATEDDPENDGETKKVEAPKGFSRTKVTSPVANPTLGDANSVLPPVTVIGTNPNDNGSGGSSSGLVVVQGPDEKGNYTTTTPATPPSIPNDTSKVPEKFNQNQTPKNKLSFGRRTTTTKTEPSFP